MSETRPIIMTVAVILGICAWILGIGIYLFTLYLAYLSGFIAFLLTFMFPFLAQVVWIFLLWNMTGAFFHPLTQLCLAWLVLFAVTVIAGANTERR